jgi:hypothetical protein
MKSIKHYIYEALKLGAGKRQSIGNNFGVNIIEEPKVVNEFNKYSETKVDKAHEALMEFLEEFSSVGIKCAELFYSGYSGYTLYHTEQPDSQSLIGYILYESTFSSTDKWYFKKNTKNHNNDVIKKEDIDEMSNWKKIE